MIFVPGGKASFSEYFCWVNPPRVGVPFRRFDGSKAFAGELFPDRILRNLCRNGEVVIEARKHDGIAAHWDDVAVGGVPAASADGEARNGQPHRNQLS